MAEIDPQIRRLQRTGLIACVSVAALAVLSGGGWRSLLGVVGGGFLVAVSFYAVRGGVDAVLRTASTRDARSRQRSMVWRLVKFITRFAILALIAYVMMVRLRAHPGWMLAGATSLVAAPAIEALRQLRARS